MSVSHLVLCGMASPDGSPCLTGMDTAGAMPEACAHYTDTHGVVVPPGFRMEIACQPGPLRVVFPVLVPEGCEL